MRSTICIECHRVLKNPKSIEIGMGPICAKKAAMRLEQQKNAKDELDLDFSQEPVKHEYFDDIVCTRTNTGPQISIPQTIVYHSPTGMEWGYGGSGPADLALNILCKFLDRSSAFKLHQAFKWQFISNLPREGGVIKNADVLKFIEKNWTVIDGNKKEATA